MRKPSSRNLSEEGFFITFAKKSFVLENSLKILFLLIFSSLFMACGGVRISESTSFKLKFLDDYIIPEDLEMDGTVVGGLSDLDYDGEYFYTVNDIPKEPIIYRFSIEIKGNKIDTVQFTKATKIQHKTEETKEMVFDSEGLNYNPESGTFTLSSEGSINKNKDPFIADIDGEGNVLETYAMPDYFSASNEKGLRNNGAFEGLTRSVSGKGLWVATELPMISDGPTAKLYGTTSPVRFTYFDSGSRKPEKQFAYKLGRLRKMPLLPFGINGVSGILEIAPEQFLVIERAYSSGHGSKGNRILIFLADAKNATNTLEIESLKSGIDREIVPAEKKLVFDFNSVRKKLSQRFADNIEGIAFGPTLANGNRSLILISDNNFNAYDEQINQVILMEIIENPKE